MNDTQVLRVRFGAACVEKLGAFPDDPAAARERILELYDGPAFPLRPLPERRRSIGDEGAVEEVESFLEVAVGELAALRERLDPSSFEAAVALVRACETEGGRMHVTGVGKPEHVAHYAASLFSSTGTPATFLHATEVVHGSAGQILAGDLVIAISNSGETGEIRAAVEVVRRMGAHVLAVTGRPDSWLGRHADATLDAGVGREGGGLGLAPRASIAAEILVLGALASALERLRDFTVSDYNLRHPGGQLGKTSR